VNCRTEFRLSQEADRTAPSSAETDNVAASLSANSHAVMPKSDEGSPPQSAGRAEISGKRSRSERSDRRPPDSQVSDAHDDFDLDPSQLPPRQNLSVKESTVSPRRPGGERVDVAGGPGFAGIFDLLGRDMLEMGVRTAVRR
jgi:hypothetical protein